MNASPIRRVVAVGGLLVLLAVGATAPLILAQTKIKPGFNIFSVEQDREIGKESAAEAERQLPILDDRAANALVDAIGKRLAAVAPGADFDYQFKVVDAADINAFALPGGYLYFNRGLIEAAKTEGQLAGVMAHEIAHVALRHGTNQASKAYLGQMGLGVLAGIVGRGDNGSTARMVGAIGGFGLNALFLKFSRTDEEQADIVGAQTMVKAGYDPQDMVDFFEMLRSTQSREPGRVEQFFSSHPPPKDRAERVRNEMRALDVQATPPVGGFEEAQASLRKLPPAPSTRQIAQKAPQDQRRNGNRSRRPVQVAIERPSSQFRTFQQRTGFFRIQHPENWRVYEPASGYGVAFAPEGGFVDAGNQEAALLCGVIVNHYDPIDRDPEREDTTGFIDDNGRAVELAHLAQATNDLVAQIIRSNPNLKLVRNSQRTDSVSGAAALSLVLAGRSDLTGEEERITVFTRELADEDVIYALFIAPGKDYGELSRTFDRMISSLEVNERAVHQ